MSLNIEQLRCKQCQNTEFIDDTEKGKKICSMCGGIVENTVYESKVDFMQNNHAAG
jgi:transcription initiation factor TFIIIB Brf1 subunit/transcription initiation factor TFIIB